jgi:hypothetical protein
MKNRSVSRSIKKRYEGLTFLLMSDGIGRRDNLKLDSLTKRRNQFMRATADLLLTCCSCRNAPELKEKRWLASSDALASGKMLTNFLSDRLVVVRMQDPTTEIHGITRAIDGLPNVRNKN